MFKRIQLDHTHLWQAMFKAPLILVYFMAPFLVGVLVSPAFAEYVNTPEWLGVFGFSAFIAVVVYINGFLGAVLFGAFLYYLLNAIRMQNRWIYWLTGFATGTFFNFMYPLYSRFLNTAREFPVLQDVPMANVALGSFPVAFGLCGMAVSWSFWRELSKGGEINAD